MAILSVPRILFALIRAASRQPTPEPLKLMKYRPDLFGGPMQKLMQEAMRGLRHGRSP